MPIPFSTARRPAGPPLAEATAPAEPSAEELGTRAAGGCRASFTRLVERFGSPLFQFLDVRTRNRADAEELVQEAFLRAWQRRARYDPQWRYTTWLFTLAERLAASRFRRRRPELFGGDEPAEVGGRGPERPDALASRREERANLWALAAKVLPSTQRTALWLRYAEELPAREIAHVLGKRESTVRVLLFRARERLARCLPLEVRPLEVRPGETDVAAARPPICSDRADAAWKGSRP